MSTQRNRSSALGGRRSLGFRASRWAASLCAGTGALDRTVVSRCGPLSSPVDREAINDFRAPFDTLLDVKRFT